MKTQREIFLIFPFYPKFLSHYKIHIKETHTQLCVYDISIVAIDGLLRARVILARAELPCRATIYSSQVTRRDKNDAKSLQNVALFCIQVAHLFSAARTTISSKWCRRDELCFLVFFFRRSLGEKKSYQREFCRSNILILLNRICFYKCTHVIIEGSPF